MIDVAEAIEWKYLCKEVINQLYCICRDDYLFYMRAGDGKPFYELVAKLFGLYISLLPHMLLFKKSILLEQLKKYFKHIHIGNINIH